MGMDRTSVGKEGKPRLLKKHTAIVHCSNTLTLLQRKISNALLYHAYDGLMKTEEHQIQIGELCKLIGYKGHNYDAIKDALRGLISTVIEWNLVDGDSKEDDWTASSILASVNLKSGICSYSYSSRMKQLLHMPSMFAKVNLYVQSHFRSSYGLALYENCVRYQGLPVTGWFDMELFRKMMGVTTDQYTVYSDFKKRVLDKAIYEVNSFSNIFIDAEVQKKGRQVVKVRFLLKERGKKKALGLKLDESSVNSKLELQDKLINVFKIKKSVAQEIVEEHSLGYILEKVELIENSYNGLGKKNIRNISGLLIDAIRTNYQNEKQEQKSITAVSPPTATNEINQANSEKLNKYDKYQHKYIMDKFYRLAEEERVLATNKFISSIKGSLYFGLYERSGFADMVIQDQLVRYLKSNKKDMLVGLLSCQDFTEMLTEFA